MAGRQQPNRGGGGNNVRQNEYFVPRDGIDREVITADICRYLGNDALVRPGNYYQESSGRNIQGYYITAYRNLTTAMIADLKADSARWEQERRKLQSGAGRYADSAVRQMGGTSTYGGQSGGGYQASNRDYGGADTMQYPGSDAPGYSAGGGSGAAAAAAHYTTTGYTNPATGYSSGQQYQAQYATQPTDTRYTTGTAPGAPMVSGYVQETPWAPPVPYAVQGQHAVQQPRAPDYMDTTMSEAPSAPAARAPNQYTGPGVRQAYPGQAPTAYSYQTVPGAGPTAYQQQSGDAFFGRGGYSATTSAPQALSDSVASPAAATGYSAATGQEQQYDEQMAAPARPTAAAAVPGTTAQIPPASGSGRRDRDRERGGERDREPHERQRDRDRDRDRERDREHRQDRGDDGQRRKAHHYGR